MNITLNILNNINTISIYNVVNTTDTIKGKKRYLIRNVRRRKCRKNPVGGQIKYKNDNERKQAHNAQSLSYYHNRPERIKYKKDIDKTLSNNDKKWVVEAYRALYCQYNFNYLITLQHGFVLDKFDKKKSKTSNDYKILEQQDKYQIKKCYSQEQCLNEALAYVNRLKKNGKYIFDNYVITIHKSHYENSYHAHIAINITDTTIVNVHTYLANRWHKSQRKKQMVKKIHNQSELIGYMMEEKKRLNADVVAVECNLNKHSKRLPNQSDLTDDLQYALNTFTHPETLKTLRTYGIR